MSTHDYNIANASGASVRSDINNALAAILSNNSNGSSPSTTVAYSIWADTTAGKLKIRNSANDAWVELINLDGTIARDISLTGDLTLTDKIIHSGDTNTAIRFPADDTFTIETAGSERLRVDSTGNVGIGGTPLEPLDIILNTTSRRLLFRHTGSVNTIQSANASSNNEAFALAGDNIRFHTGSSGAGSEVVRIDSSGNCGIGTASPTHLLHLESASTPALKIKDTTNNATLLAYAQDADAHIGTYSNHSLIFDTNSSTAMTLNTSGSLVIQGSLVVQSSSGTSYNSAGNIQVPVTSTSVGAWLSSTSSTSTVKHMRFENPNNTVGTITTSSSATAYNTSSDYRLKENAVTISDGITRLKTLKPYRFNWKADATITVDGFFAHEVTAVPEAISGVKDEVVTQAMVDAGDYDSSKLNDPIYQEIDQSKLVPLLTAAIQEAVVKIETLETKVAALEAA